MRKRGYWSSLSRRIHHKLEFNDWLKRMIHDLELDRISSLNPKIKIRNTIYYKDTYEYDTEEEDKDLPACTDEDNTIIEDYFERPAIASSSGLSQKEKDNILTF